MTVKDWGGRDTKADDWEVTLFEKSLEGVAEKGASGPQGEPSAASSDPQAGSRVRSGVFGPLPLGVNHFSGERPWPC